MPISKFCKQCHKPLTEAAPEGLCPECLAKVDLGSEPDSGREQTPPNPADFARPFPQSETRGEIAAATMQPSGDDERPMDPANEAQPAAAGQRTYRRFDVFFLMALVMIAVILGLMAANRHWNKRTDTAQPAAGFKAAEAAGVDVLQQNRAKMNEHRHGVTLDFVKVDSEETFGEKAYGEFAVDGNPDTFWHTEWNHNSPGLPHEIIIELLPPSTIKGFTYLPRQDESDHGTIRDYEFYVSDDGKNFGQPVKKGSFEPGKELKTETFEPIKCRFIKLRAISEINGLNFTSAAEIGVVQSSEAASGKGEH